MPKAPRFKTLLFDMDGVLVDVSRSYRRAIEETVIHFTGREVLSGVVQRYKNLGGFNDDWKLTHAIITDTGIKVPMSRVVHEFQKRYRGDNWDGFIAEEPSLIEDGTLRDLCSDDCVMGIVTGRPEAEAQWTLRMKAWKQYFPLVIAKEKQEGRGKPDPYPLQHALAILGAAGRKVRPREAVYIGDSVDDMRSATAAGMWAVGIVPPYLDSDNHEKVLLEAGADTVCTDCNSLPDVLEKLARTPASAPGL